MKKCTGCQVEKLESGFYILKSGKLRAECKECILCRNRSYRKENPKKVKKWQENKKKLPSYHSTMYKNNPKYRDHVKAKKKERRRPIEELKTKNPCTDCHNFYPAACMEFDHVRGTKTSDITTMLRTNRPMAIILEEIAKCELVCANCHRLRTTSRRSKLHSLNRDSRVS